MSSHTGKIAIFIDGPNLHATTKSLGFDVDYKLLVREFESRGALVRALYYAVLAEYQEFSILRPLVDWLDYNGYAVVTKPTKEFIDASGRRKVKANMDVERGHHYDCKSRDLRFLARPERWRPRTSCC